MIKFSIHLLSFFIFNIIVITASYSDNAKPNLHQYSKCDVHGCQIKGTVGTYPAALSCLVRNKSDTPNDFHPSNNMANRVILYGPPGTGKTNLIKKLADEEGAFLEIFKGTELNRPHHGEGAIKLEDKIQQARIKLKNFYIANPDSDKRGFFLFDEFDSFASKNEYEASQSRNDVKQTLCQIMDQLKEKVTTNDKNDLNQYNEKIVICCITNKYENLDLAMTGRFGPNQIEILHQNPNDRISIIKYFDSKLTTKLIEQEESYIINNTQDFSVRDIQDLFEQIEKTKITHNYNQNTIACLVKVTQNTINISRNSKKNKDLEAIQYSNAVHQNEQYLLAKKDREEQRIREARQDKREEDMTRVQGAILGGFVGKAIVVVSGPDKSASATTSIIPSAIPISACSSISPSTSIAPAVAATSSSGILGMACLTSQCPIPGFIIIGTCAYLGQYLLHHHYYGDKKNK